MISKKCRGRIYFGPLMYNKTISIIQLDWAKSKFPFEFSKGWIAYFGYAQQPRRGSVFEKIRKEKYMKKIIISTIFYLMMFFRKPFLIVGKFIGGIFFLGFLIAIFSGATQMIFACLIISFVFFMLCYFYDTLLLKLNPTNNDLYLSQ
jgi:hypothetical protein